MTPFDHFLYGLAWIGFGVLHSLFASSKIKAVLAPMFGRGYRLFYNLKALALTGTVILFGEWVLADDSMWEVHIWWTVLSVLFIGGGGLILFFALKGYDGGRFIGVSQLRDPSADDDSEPLSVTGANKFIRHPLYTGAILVMFGRAESEAQLATALWITAYFFIGARFEERRLITRFGAPYEEYCARVAAFVPGLKWLR